MTVTELKILLDINHGNAKNVLEAYASSKCKYGYFFVDSNDGHCYLFDDRGNEKDISIIKEIDDTMIRKDIKKIVIPNSVINIRNWAFSGRNRLKSATIGNSVMSIGDWAFAGCHNLTSVTISESVTSIGDYAFEDCNIALFNTTTIPGVKLVNDWVVGYMDSLYGNLNLKGAHHIGSGVFNRCNELTRVIIPDNVTSIGDWAFYRCSGLKSVTIQDSVKSIGEWAFSGCNNLTNVIFKNKTLKEVKAMKYYPWGIEDESIIKVKFS